MIGPDARIELAPCVTLDAGVVVDDVRGVRLQANPTATLVLEHADGRTVAELGDVLTRAGAQDGVRDARAFCAQLNRHLLVNVRAGRAALLRRRRPLRRVDARSLSALVGALAPTGLVLTALALPLALLAGVWTAALGVGAGVVLHELAHAVALHGVPRALVLDGLRPSILHPPLGAARSILVAAAGPLAPALCALVVAWLLRPAAPACAPLAAHALGLTVLAPDGRNACGLS